MQMDVQARRRSEGILGHATKICLLERQACDRKVQMMCIVELSIVGATVNFARSYLLWLYKSVFRQVRLGRMICWVPSASISSVRQ
jgi:hypothetical protein